MLQSEPKAFISHHFRAGYSDDQHLLCIRLKELAEINGHEWIYRHRERLLRQWAAAIDHDP